MNTAVWYTLAILDFIMKTSNFNSPSSLGPTLSYYYADNVKTFKNLDSPPVFRSISFLNSLIYLSLFLWKYHYNSYALFLNVDSSFYMLYIHTVRYFYECYNSLGLLSALRFSELGTKLAIKHWFLMNFTMSVFRWYWILRCFETYSETSMLEYSFENNQLAALFFCRDALCVIGSTGFVSWLVMLANRLLQISDDDRHNLNRHFDRFMECTVTGSYLILSLFNVYTYDWEARCSNVPAIIYFTILTYILMLPIYAWLTEMTVESRTLVNHWKFFDSMLIMCFIGYFDFVISIEHEDMRQLFRLFQRQLLFTAVIGILTCGSYVLINSYIKLNPAAKEDLQKTNMILTYFAEAAIAVLIIDGVTTKKYFWHKFEAPTEMMLCMIYLNAFNILWHLGISCALVKYATWLSAKRIILSMKPNQKSFDGIRFCALCEDGFSKTELTELRRAACSHVFHYPCIREYLETHASVCPNCKRDLTNEESVLSDEDESHRRFFRDVLNLMIQTDDELSMFSDVTFRDSFIDDDVTNDDGDDVSDEGDPVLVNEEFSDSSQYSSDELK